MKSTGFERPLSGKADIRHAHPVSAQTTQIRRLRYPNKQAMLTEIYIEALLVDEELADQVWEAWDVAEIDDLVACIAWLQVVTRV